MLNAHSGNIYMMMFEVIMLILIIIEPKYLKKPDLMLALDKNWSLKLLQYISRKTKFWSPLYAGDRSQ